MKIMTTFANLELNKNVQTQLIAILTVPNDLVSLVQLVSIPDVCHVVIVAGRAAGSCSKGSKPDQFVVPPEQAFQLRLGK